MAGGLKAKLEGDSFENAFIRACQRYSIVWTRMPLGCKRIGRGPRDLIQIKTAFDFILSYQGQTALIDTKSIAGSRFKPSQITTHQLSELMAHEGAGTPSGYVIWMRALDEVLYVKAELLNRTIRDAQSLTPESYAEIVSLGNTFTFDPRKIFLPRQV